MKIYKAITSIIPNRLIYQKKLYSITEIDNDHIINKYNIFINSDNRIIKVIIDCDHVNSDPENDIFCLPDNFKNRKISKKLIKEIEILFETYNLDNCFFMPWHYIKYDKYSDKYKKRNNSFIMKSYNVLNRIRNFHIN